jgi:hypothetical protein
MIFLKLWFAFVVHYQSADPALPEVADAKERLSSLKNQ